LKLETIFEMANFIEIYDDVIDTQRCSQIIEGFEKSNNIKRGNTGHGVDISKKDSYDLTITQLPEWEHIVQQILNNTFLHLKSYLHKYSFALVGALSPSLPDPVTNQPVTISYENFNVFEEAWMNALIQRLYRPSHINIQKYLKGIGGYHHWHSEIFPSPHDPYNDSLHRVLFFQYYLNTVEEGGETEFFYQDLKVKPKQGSLIIAPAGFTHTHKGHIPISGDKYILTSWILFQRAEFLYGQALQ